MDPIQIASIFLLIFSIVLHEMAHGYAANWLGDPTARMAGRLSPNPLVHLDLLGSIIIPGMLILGQAQFLFGWAKPVPYNPYNLKNQRWGEAIVAAAGPAINIVVAIVFALLIRAAIPLGLPVTFIELAHFVVYINILLAFFNMIPIPPLDGSKILLALLPFGTPRTQYEKFITAFQQFGILGSFLFIFVFITLFWEPFASLVFVVSGALTGL